MSQEKKTNRTFHFVLSMYMSVVESFLSALDSGLLCSLASPGINSVDQAGLREPHSSCWGDKRFHSFCDLAERKFKDVLMIHTHGQYRAEL